MTVFVWILELVSLCLRALTLAVRLYGNMFAGHMALGIFALLASGFIQYGIGIGMQAISVGWIAFLVIMYALETLVAFIQAYVFTVLSAVYISLAIHEH